MTTPDILIPPRFCQYASGPCDQSFSKLDPKRFFVMYPNEPSTISRTLESALDRIKAHRRASTVAGWKDLPNAGRMVFCEICKALRASEFGAADISTLNFNVLFEIGFALGLGKPVLPLRDSSYERDKKAYSELGLFDTWGYHDFQNSDDVVSALSGKIPPYPLSESALTRGAGTVPTLFLIKSPIDSEHSIRLISLLSRCAFTVKAFDQQETPRLALQDAVRQVAYSGAVITHLIDANRKGATTHNGRCAFVAGLAMAMGKPTLMLQEGEFTQPLDYRDVVVMCKDASQIHALVATFIRQVVRKVEHDTQTGIRLQHDSLSRIDLGDMSAENETDALKTYFVSTAEFSQISRGRTRVVVGRKGTGKTAIFLKIKDLFWKKDSFVVELKPEGHQFVELKEAVLRFMSAGAQEHTVTAFWNYLLMMELAFAIIEADKNTPDAYKPLYIDVFNAYRRMRQQTKERSQNA